MADIGAMLREARMRSRIDISEIEAHTKIRAKYLRALENEEWDLLPGPTFVKSFLRTYADALGLDSRLIVEEYKLHHERPSEFDLQPIRSPAAGRERRGPPGPPVPPRWLIGGVIAVVLLALLAVLGSIGGSSSPPSPRRGASSAKRAAPPPARPVTRPRSTRVALQLVPSAPVWVCLETGTGARLINGVILSPGSAQPVYRAKKFLINLGNGQLQLRVDGRLLAVPNSSNPIGYSLTRTAGRKPLPVGQRPTCS
jgi:hypothetical protein